MQLVLLSKKTITYIYPSPLTYTHSRFSRRRPRLLQLPACRLLAVIVRDGAVRQGVPIVVPILREVQVKHVLRAVVVSARLHPDHNRIVPRRLSPRIDVDCPF